MVGRTHHRSRLARRQN